MVQFLILIYLFLFLFGNLTKCDSEIEYKLEARRGPSSNNNKILINRNLRETFYSGFEYASGYNQKPQIGIKQLSLMPTGATKSNVYDFKILPPKSFSLPYNVLL